MLDTLVSVVNLFKTTFYYGFYISYNTGFFLVSSVNSICNFCVVLTYNVTSFFLLLYESMVFFIQDIAQFIQQLLVLANTLVEAIYSSVATVVLKIYFFVSSIFALISSIYNGLGNGLTAICDSIGHTIAFLKNLMILFGSGVWFLITLVPFLLYYLCTLCISFIHSIYQEICDICSSGVFNVKTLIKNIVLFILDVPIESIAGLIIALSLAYTFKQFYVLIIPYFKRQLRNVKNLIRQHWQVTETFSHYFGSYSRQLARQEPIIQTPRARRAVRQAPAPAQQRVQPRLPVRGRREIEEKQENSLSLVDRYCVICQERSKCILLLPCKHLCLCSECIQELRYYNEVCPICRTNIESTMKIFI